jgi:catechol-2,3-dioxygenase
MTQIGSAFLPVNDPTAAAEWYSTVFGLSVTSSEEHAAVLESAAPVARLTLMGPKSGIAATPGLGWAPFNLIVEDLQAMRKLLADAGIDAGAVNGDDQTCFWFTAADLDGNTLLIVDR